MKLKIYFVVVFILALVGWLEYRWMMPNEFTLNEYKTLLSNYSLIKETQHHKEPFSAMQKKIGVLKDFFFEKNDRQHQMRLRSDDCELIYLYANEEKEIVEKFTNVDCILQEEFYYDENKKTYLQMIKFFKAKEAIFSFSKDSFIAYDAKIFQYKIEGTKIPDFEDLTGDLLLESDANKVEVKIEDKEILMIANELKGMLKTKHE